MPEQVFMMPEEFKTMAAFAMNIQLHWLNMTMRSGHDYDADDLLRFVEASNNRLFMKIIDSSDIDGKFSVELHNEQGTCFNPKPEHRFDQFSRSLKLKFS